MTTIVISKNTGADFAGVEDVQIASGAATSNLEGGTNIDVRTADGNFGLLRFSGIPSVAGAVVSSATLTLVNGFAGAFTLQLFRLKRAWNVAQATYNNFATGSAWGTAGAQNRSTDTDATAFATSTQTGAGGANTPFTIGGAALAALVQDWMTGAQPNNGILLQIDAGTDGLGFPSCEGADGLRPSLQVVYTVSGGGGGASGRPIRATYGLF